MTTQLALRYRFDQTDDFGWLEAELSTARVGGTLGFWVQWQDLKEWAAELAAFPMKAGHSSEVDWGFAESDGGPYQSIVKIRIDCGATGHLHISTELADHIEPQINCRGIFDSDFPALEQFARDLAAMMDRKADEAVFAGTEAP
jgi:hypothetical protein